MDRLTVLASFVITLTLVALEDAFALHDLVTGGGPDAELRRYLAAHPNATVHTLNRHPAAPPNRRTPWQ